MPQHLEDAHQIALIEWAEWTGKQIYPELKWLYHIPNGGKRGKAEAARLKRMGVKAGVSDLFLPVPRGGYHGLYIEMKAKGGRLSKEQKEFIPFAKSQGYCVEVKWTYDGARELIEWYLALPK